MNLTAQTSGQISSIPELRARNVYLMMRLVLAHPIQHLRSARRGPASSRHRIEQERTGSRIDHRLMPGGRFQNDPVEDGYLLIRKAGKSRSIAFEHFFTSVRRCLKAQAFGKSLRDHTAQIHFPDTGAIRCASVRESTGNVRVVRRFFSEDDRCGLRLIDTLFHPIASRHQSAHQ